MKQKLGLLFLATTLIACMLVGCKKEEAYRVIKVNSFEGETAMNRGEEAVELFEGIQLVSNDKVTTGSDGLIELLVDSDKNIAASEDTCFSIEAVGNETQGKVTIHLEYGTTLIEIQNKLTDGSEFEVVTPNATLSVRGTTFEVTYDTAANETTLKVIDGVVEATTNIESREINAGETIVIQDVNIIDDGDSETGETAEEESTEHDPSTDDIAHTEDIKETLVSEAGDTLSVKLLEGYGEYANEDGSSWSSYTNGVYHISYGYNDGNALTIYNDSIDYYTNMVRIEGELENKELINDDGDTVYYTQWMDVEGGLSFTLYKQIGENHCVTISVTKEVDGSYVRIEPEEVLDLTKDCYYVIE